MLCSLMEVSFNLFNICSTILLSLSFNGIIQKQANIFSSSDGTFISLAMVMGSEALAFTA